MAVISVIIIVVITVQICTVIILVIFIASLVCVGGWGEHALASCSEAVGHRTPQLP